MKFTMYLFLLTILISCSGGKGGDKKEVANTPTVSLKEDSQELFYQGSFVVPANGVNLDVITTVPGARYECLNCPPGLTIDNKTGVISGDITPGWDNELDIKVTVNDKIQTVSVPVKQVDKTAPTDLILSQDNFSIDLDNPSSINLNIVSTNTSDVTFELTSGPSYITVNPITGKITIDPPNNITSGSGVIEITVRNELGSYIKTVPYTIARKPTVDTVSNTIYRNSFCSTVTNPNGGQVRLELKAPISAVGNYVNDSGTSCVDISSITDGANIPVSYIASGSGSYSVEKNITIIKDTVAPVLSAKTNLPMGFLNQNQTSNFVFTDTLSGLAPFAPLYCEINTEGLDQSCAVNTDLICDNAGNCMSGHIFSYEIDLDKTPPVFSSKTAITAGWKNSNITSVFTYTDAVSGLNGSQPECTITTEGLAQTCSLNSVQICDNANNCVTENLVSNSADIDKTAPNLLSQSIIENGISTNGFYTADQSSDFVFQDSLSGVSGQNTFSCTISSEGSNQTCSINENVCDNAGNCSVQNLTSNSVNIDKTPPVLSSKTSLNTDWINQDSIQEFVFSDSVSGVSGSSTRSCSITTEGANQTCSISAGSVCDIAGNCIISATESHLVNIDKTVPVFVSKNTPAFSWYNTDQTATFTFDDTLSGLETAVRSCTISTEGTSSSCSVNENVCDRAGNCINHSDVSGTIQLDKTMPTYSGGTYSASPRSLGLYEKGTSYTINIDDALSGVSTSTASCVYNTSSIDSSDLKTCSINICDIAGNCTTSNSPSNQIYEWKVLAVSNITGNTSTNDHPAYQTIFQGNLYFVAHNGVANKIYKYDGNSVVPAFGAGGLRNDPTLDEALNDMIVYNNELYMFPAWTGIGMIRYDGTNPPVEILNTATPGAVNNTYYPTVCNGKMYYQGLYSGMTVFKTYSWDGTTASIAGVTGSTGSLSSSDDPAQFHCHGTDLYMFSKNSGGTPKLYKLSTVNNTYTAIGGTNGTSGASGVADYTVSDYSRRNYFASMGSDVYIVGKIAGGYKKMFKWDGTTLVRIGNTSENLSANDETTNLSVIDGKIYFASNNSGGHQKTYFYDGTSITQVNGILGTSGSASTPDNSIGFIKYDNRIFFGARNSVGSKKLHVLDTTTTATQSSYLSGFAGTQEDFLRPLVFNDELIYRSFNTSNRTKLFKLTYK